MSQFAGGCKPLIPARKLAVLAESKGVKLIQFPCKFARHGRSFCIVAAGGQQTIDDIHRAFHVYFREVEG